MIEVALFSVYGTQESALETLRAASADMEHFNFPPESKKQKSDAQRRVSR